ncbi:MAG: hypothetical protein Q4C34_02110, partial [Bacteroidales bacterium]|nr:hypothetical protein [Bacteroidales bacterium]
MIDWYFYYSRINRYFRKITTVTSCFGGLSKEELIEFAETSPFEADILWKKRNVVWKTNKYGHTFVVKTFGGNVWSSIIYAFRKSKARRSYEHAQELCARGIDTPCPIGFVEVRGLFNILSHSCYTSLYISAIPLKYAIERYGDPIIESFASFVARLLEKPEQTGTVRRRWLGHF